MNATISVFPGLGIFIIGSIITVLDNGWMAVKSIVHLYRYGGGGGGGGGVLLCVTL